VIGKTKTLPLTNTDDTDQNRFTGIAKIEIQNLEPQRTEGTQRNTEEGKIGRSGVERMDDWIAALAFHSR